MNSYEFNVNARPYECYLISGQQDDWQQVICQQIQSYWQNKGYINKVFKADNWVSWEIIERTRNNLQLFSEKYIHCFHLNSLSFKYIDYIRLIEFIEQDQDGSIYILLDNKSLSYLQKQAWIKKFIQHSSSYVFIHCTYVYSQQFKKWIKFNFSKSKYLLKDDSIQMIARRAHGQPSAVQNLLKQLQLLLVPGSDSDIFVKILLNQQQHFETFELTHAIESKNIKKIGQVISTFKQKDLAPSLLLWVLTQMMNVQQSNPLFITFAVYIDQVIKGLIPGDPWLMLNDLGISLASNDSRLIKLWPTWEEMSIYNH